MSCNRCGSRTPRNALCKQCALAKRHTPARDDDADTAATDDANEYRCCECETEYFDDGSGGCPDCGSKRRQYIGELATDGGQCADGTDRDGQVRWYYAIDHSEAFETRHEAVGKAAIINRGRDNRRRDVTVWAYPECDCDESVITLDHGNTCGRCGTVIA